MIVCKVCKCGNILEFEPPFEECPDYCPNCGNSTKEYLSYRIDDPEVKRLKEEYSHVGSHQVEVAPVEESPAENFQAELFQTEETQAEIIQTEKMQAENTQAEMFQAETSEMTTKNKTSFLLRAVISGVVISLPQEACIVGRTAVGAEELAHNNGISRKHLNIEPCGDKQGIIVTDISKYGTKINGEVIKKACHSSLDRKTGSHCLMKSIYLK